MSPLISVYITNYNYERFIKKAIDSVLAQSCSDFELLIIDDGSTDDSKKIIESYSSNFKIKIIYQHNKGLNVKPEGCELEFVIKKSQIAVASQDSRPSRFVGGERIDAAISEINFEKRKVSLSIKLLEELQNKEAVTKFSSPLSGKNLPFSSLSEKLSDKKNKDDE